MAARGAGGRKPPQVQSTPYTGLTPDAVLDALETVGLRGDGRLLGLNSYENRVYQIYLEDGTIVVAKFYRAERWTDAQILEEHAFTAELAAREIPVVAPLVLAPIAPGSDAWRPGETMAPAQGENRSGGRHETTLHHAGGFRFAVYPRRGGRAPELDNRQTLEWIGRFIGRIHAVGASKPFRSRPRLDIANFGEEPRSWLLKHRFIPPELIQAWTSVADLALAGVRASFARAGAVSNIRLHGDCHASNILWTDDGPHFVDFDDCRTGPAIQDLWMLLSGDRETMAGQLGALLAGYEDFSELDRRELLLVEALRTLRLIHYSAWLARRWDDPAFPAAFPWFNTPRYWQDRILELREQVGAMEELPLQPGT